jgi:predicted HTH domain antitoxin
MALSLTIPNEIITSVKVPRGQIKQALTREMAFTLYARGMASLGTARRFAKLSKWEFIEGLNERGIERHYDDEELREDIDYAHRCQ